jgi:hypothetical protein
LIMGLRGGGVWRFIKGGCKMVEGEFAMFKLKGEA